MMNKLQKESCILSKCPNFGSSDLLKHQVHYLRFPEARNDQEVWCDKLELRIPNKRVIKQWRLCSLHFKPSDLITNCNMTKTIETACPCLNLEFIGDDIQNNNRNSTETVSKQVESLQPVEGNGIIMDNLKPIKTVTIRSTFPEGMKRSSNSTIDQQRLSIVCAEICRVCMSPLPAEYGDHGYKNMLTSFVQGKRYSEVYEFCIGHSITTHNALEKSVRICLSCEEHLLISFQFKIQCLKTDKILKLKRLKISDDENYNTLTGLIQMNTVEDHHSILKINDESNTKNRNELEMRSLSVENMEIVNIASPIPETHCSEKVEIDTLAITDDNDINDEDVVEPSIETNFRSTDSDSDIPDSEMLTSDLDFIFKPINENSKIRSKKTDTLCPICGKILKAFTLEQHMAVHQADPSERRSFVCYICGMAYARKASLNSHNANKHVKNKSFNCSYCGETFETYNTFRYHTRKMHMKHKYNCTFCTKTYVTSKQLKTHIRTHTGEVPPKYFHCSYLPCNKSFTYKSHLKAHESAKHLGMPLYKCDMCDKSYVFPKALAYHKKVIHKNEMDCLCPLCPKGFYRNSDLRYHMIRMHPEYELPERGVKIL